jgi:hypothetical protein
MGNDRVEAGAGSADVREPVLRSIPVDMTNTGERALVNRGDVVYTLFLETLAVGTTSFEVRVNDQWLRMREGDRIEMGDCYPTRVGILVRSQPALPGLFSSVIVSATPQTTLERA